MSKPYTVIGVLDYSVAPRRFAQAYVVDSAHAAEQQALSDEPNLLVAGVLAGMHRTAESIEQAETALTRIVAAGAVDAAAFANSFPFAEVARDVALVRALRFAQACGDIADGPLSSAPEYLALVPGELEQITDSWLSVFDERSRLRIDALAAESDVDFSEARRSCALGGSIVSRAADVLGDSELSRRCQLVELRAGSEDDRVEVATLVADAVADIYIWAASCGLDVDEARSRANSYFAETLPALKAAAR